MRYGTPTKPKIHSEKVNMKVFIAALYEVGIELSREHLLFCIVLYPLSKHYEIINIRFTQ